MRSYGQYCSVAKALDVLGERWTLLIVRELLARGACRYTDLRASLPGIASNLLADRLRELEAAGIVLREEAPPPVATALFSLTERGRALEPVITELGRWGAPLMRDSDPDEHFRGQWLQLPVRMFLTDRDPRRPASTVEVRAGDQTVVVGAEAGQVWTRLGGDPDADAVLTGSPRDVLRVFSGADSLGEALTRGLRIDGSRAAVERLLPARPQALGTRKGAAHSRVPSLPTAVARLRRRQGHRDHPGRILVGFSKNSAGTSITVAGQTY